MGHHELSKDIIAILYAKNEASLQFLFDSMINKTQLIE